MLCRICFLTRARCVFRELNTLTYLIVVICNGYVSYVGDVKFVICELIINVCVCNVSVLYNDIYVLCVVVCNCGEKMISFLAPKILFLKTKKISPKIFEL